MRTQEHEVPLFDLAQQFITKATTQQLVKEITTRNAILECPLPDYLSFLTLAIPESFRVTSLGFSKNGVHVVDFTYLDRQNRTTTIPVVAKQLGYEAYMHERVVYKRLQENPVQFPYFKPVFFVGSPDMFYLGTKAEPNSIPLSHLLKQIFVVERQPQRLLAAYKRIAVSGSLALLRLHAIGILHEDWQPKNFGIDTRTGGVYAYDFERSSVTDCWSHPSDPFSSLDEVSNFLATCTFYAIHGYLPDDLVSEDSDSPHQSRMKRKKLLRQLGLDEKQFFSINGSIMYACRQYYKEVEKRQTTWSSVEHGHMQALLFQNMPL